MGSTAKVTVFFEKGRLQLNSFSLLVPVSAKSLKIFNLATHNC